MFCWQHALFDLVCVQQKIQKRRSKTVNKINQKKKQKIINRAKNEIEKQGEYWKGKEFWA